MTLYMIGLGLFEQDIPYRGLKILKKCSSVYLENYTSKLIDVDDFKKLVGKEIILADREMVEKKAEDVILKDALKKDVCFCVMGDVFSATTHVDLMLRAKKKGISVRIIHAGSIITGVGDSGLRLYNFGKITSVPFENENIKAPLEVIKNNLGLGYHTLVLLDLEPDNDKYMSVSEALGFLVKNGMEDRICVGFGGLGCLEPEIKVGKASELIKSKMIKYPQCLVVCGKLSFVEEEALEMFK